MRELWVAFMRNDEELCAYTVKGTFPGELKATLELIAEENGCRPEEIFIKIRGRLKHNETTMNPKNDF